jgi:hypothetical protein
MRLLEALDDSCMLGYAWANAEADHKMRPLALSALAQRAGSAEGGKKRGAQRRAEAAATWQADVKAKALRVRKERPGISQRELASEIKIELDDKVPSDAVIERHLRTLERRGQLPKRQKARERPSDAHSSALRRLGNRRPS